MILRNAENVETLVKEQHESIGQPRREADDNPIKSNSSAPPSA